MFINTHKKKKKLSLPEATHVEIDGNAVFVWGFFLVFTSPARTTSKQRKYDNHRLVKELNINSYLWEKVGYSTIHRRKNMATEKKSCFC